MSLIMLGFSNDGNLVEFHSFLRKLIPRDFIRGPQTLLFKRSVPLRYFIRETLEDV